MDNTEHYFDWAATSPLDKEIAGTFISQFNSKQVVKNFIMQHATFIKEDIIKAVEEYK